MPSGTMFLPMSARQRGQGCMQASSRPNQDLEASPRLSQSTSGALAPLPSLAGARCRRVGVDATATAAAAVLPNLNLQKVSQLRCHAEEAMSRL